MPNALRISTIFLAGALLCVAILAFAPLAHAAHHRPRLERLRMDVLTGAQAMRASYYGGGERLNARTASGERFRPGGFTAAHRSFAFGTRLRVCLRGCATVRVNDRGPAAWTGRALDLSRGAAAAIGLIGPGVATIRVSRL